MYQLNIGYNYSVFRNSKGHIWFPFGNLMTALICRAL